MRKTAFLLLVALTSARAAQAQAVCPPVLSVLANQQAIPPAGFQLVPRATLQISPGPGCPGSVRYAFTAAELTLMRNGRPVLPTKVVRQPNINMLEFARAYQPGDRLYVFVPFQNLLGVAADGTKTIYRQPSPKPAGVDLRTDQQQGLSFVWVLLGR